MRGRGGNGTGPDRTAPGLPAGEAALEAELDRRLGYGYTHVHDAYVPPQQHQRMPRLARRAAPRLSWAIGRGPGSCSRRRPGRVPRRPLRCSRRRADLGEEVVTVERAAGSQKRPNSSGVKARWPSPPPPRRAEREGHGNS
jgi:hypothetical protein